MALGAFVAPGTPIMANYIPVLDGPLFLAGLVVFAAGFALLVLRAPARRAARWAARSTAPARCASASTPARCRPPSR